MHRTAYIGIGSNLGDRLAHCKHALELLADRSDIRILRISPWYESDAETLDGAAAPQPPYLNGVVSIATRLTPEALLDALQEIELSLGRPRVRAKGEPRTIDLDLLLLDAERRATQTLALPHPGLSKRSFVLQPLCDIAPHVVDPESGLSAQTLLERSRERGTPQQLRRLS
jgi:2-amino-4-hydroxy-6-hydroxymethyldihydropteridine diphosphokinase